MYNILKNSGIPLKISFVSVLIFILGISYIIYFSTKNFNREIDERIQANAKSLAALINKEYLLQIEHSGIDLETTMRNSIQTEVFLQKIAIVDAFNGTYIFSTESTDLNQPVSQELLEIMNAGERDVINQDRISYLDGDELIDALQFSSKIINLNAPINPVGYIQFLYGQEQINQKKINYFNSILIVSFVVMVLCFLLMFLFLSKISLTIQKIYIAIEGLGKNVYNFDLNDRHDELGLLIRALENLKNYIKNLNSKLRLLEMDNKSANKLDRQDGGIGHPIVNERNGVFAKIFVEPLHSLLYKSNYQHVLQMSREISEFLRSHFSQYNGSVIFFDGSTAMIHFQTSQKEKSAIESLIQLSKKIKILSPDNMELKKSKLSVRGALHRGNLVYSEVFTEENGFNAFVGNLYQELNLLFNQANRDEIVVSSKIALITDAKYNAVKRSEKIPLENQPDLELYSLSQNEAGNVAHLSHALQQPQKPYSDAEAKQGKTKWSAAGLDSPSMVPEEETTGGISAMVDEVFTKQSFDK